MAELTTIDKLRKAHNIGYAQAEQALAGLQPIHTMPNGQGVMKLYDKDQADLAIIAYKAERDKPKAPAKAEQQPAVVVDLSPLLKQVDDANGRIDLMAEQVTKLGDQNRVLLRAIDTLRADVMARLDTLAGNIDQILLLARAVHEKPEAAGETPPEVLPAQVRLMPVSATPEADPPRLCIMIVGVEPSWINQLEREFGKVMKLDLVRSQDAKGSGYLGRLARADHVIGMTAFINDGGLRATIVAAGQRFVRVTGGISMLRDKLTELYVQPKAA